MRPNQQFIDSLNVKGLPFIITYDIGSEITLPDGDTVITFTQDATMTVLGGGLVRVLIVGGGSGGNKNTVSGTRGGGGGGGGGLWETNIYGGAPYVDKLPSPTLPAYLTTTIYPVIIGKGGLGATQSGNGKGGSASYIFNLRSSLGSPGTSPDVRWGNIDGDLNNPSNTPTSTWGSGGSSTQYAGYALGNGGDAYSSNITGSTVLYGAGGGGGIWAISTASGKLGGNGAPNDGAGDGGGITGTTPTNGTNALDNRGGGGGGNSLTNSASSNGGNGGSGVIIIRYKKITY